MTNEETIEWFTMLREKFTGTKYGEYLDMAIKALEARETATWEYVQYASPKISNFRCSNCWCIAIDHIQSKYCPHCGARMVEPIGKRGRGCR